jgi:8-oxo-dGTP pyrophosphatase MutT (NUDIX family)
MAFAPGMYAFPGGGVSSEDTGPEAAAVRETFEETGVLLGAPAGAATDTAASEWEADRAALTSHALTFADILARRGLVLRGDALHPFARWITPEFEERRYDTWFYLAALPQGQDARDVSGEADRTAWLTAARAVAGYERGELAMLPPTIRMLRDLLPYRRVADALAGARGRDLSPVMATATVDAAGAVVLSWPGRAEEGA